MNCQITSNKEYDWMPIMVASECFASEQNTKTVATLSSLYVSQTSPTSYFGYYGQVWPLPSKMIMPTCRKLMFICMQKMNSIPNFFSEILQIHVFFHKELHFWGYCQVCLANLCFQGQKLLRSCLAISKTFTFRNLYWQYIVTVVYIFRMLRTFFTGIDLSFHSKFTFKICQFNCLF